MQSTGHLGRKGGLGTPRSKPQLDLWGPKQLASKCLYFKGSFHVGSCARSLPAMQLQSSAFPSHLSFLVVPGTHVDPDRERQAESGWDGDDNGMSPSVILYCQVRAMTGRGDRLGMTPAKAWRTWKARCLGGLCQRGREDSGCLV